MNLTRLVFLRHKEAALNEIIGLDGAVLLALGVGIHARLAAVAGLDDSGRSLERCGREILMDSLHGIFPDPSRAVPVLLGDLGLLEAVVVSVPDGSCVIRSVSAEPLIDVVLPAVSICLPLAFLICPP